MYTNVFVENRRRFVPRVLFRTLLQNVEKKTKTTNVLQNYKTKKYVTIPIKSSKAIN